MCIIHYVLKGFQTYFIHPEGSSVNFDLIKDVSPQLPLTVAVNEKLYFEVFTKTKTFIYKIMLLIAAFKHHMCLWPTACNKIFELSFSTL